MPFGRGLTQNFGLIRFTDHSPLVRNKDCMHHLVQNPSTSYPQCLQFQLRVPKGRRQQSSLRSQQPTPSAQFQMTPDRSQTTRARSQEGATQAISFRPLCRQRCDDLCLLEEPRCFLHDQMLRQHVHRRCSRRVLDRHEPGQRSQA